MSDITKYVVVTPVRDEEGHVEQTIRSMVAQTIKPIEWVLVDDGSTDKTGKIIDAYSREYPWIKSLHRGNRGFRKAGGGVIEAFYEGFKSVESRDWEFIVKLDGDVSFEADYFERCFQEFYLNPQLGIGGGTIGQIVNDEFEIEKNPLFHVRGATKIYKRDCWNAIGELQKAPGWDTLDEVKANMLGWSTSTFPKIKIVHHKNTGSADGIWSNWIKNGKANYISGYHPLFMTVKCIRRAFQKPYLLGALGLSCGFLIGYIRKIPQVSDTDLIKYLRRQQIRRLTGRKSMWR